MEERVTPPKYALWAYKTGSRARLIDTSAKLAVFAVVALKLFKPVLRWSVVVGLYVIILSTISMTAIFPISP